MIRRIASRLALAASLIGASHGASALDFSIPQHDTTEQFHWVTHDLGLPRIYASGLIEAGDAERLAAFLKDTGTGSGIVLFSSPGGSLQEGVLLGETIRKHGLSTGIAQFDNGAMRKAGQCASACAYAFVGGIHRYYEAGDQQLGVHQFYASGPDAISSSETQKISGLLVAYLKGMGVDPLAFTVSASAGPDGMFWLTTEQAIELQIATNGLSSAVAELKQAQGATYLSVEQDNGGPLGRFLFFCGSQQQVMLVGGFVSTPEDTANKHEWATWSALKVGTKTIYPVRKADDPQSINQAGSMVSAGRTLSRSDIITLLKERSVGFVFGADGMLAYGTTADLSPVISKVEAFVTNCTAPAR